MPNTTHPSSSSLMRLRGKEITVERGNEREGLRTEMMLREPETREE